MRATTTSCDPDRLEKLLANALGEAEQAGLIAHLDGCTTCQRSLDALVAGPRFWDEIRHLAGHETQDEAPAAETDLDFLDPPDNPQTLGRLGIYEVIEVIGQGGFARVFKALDPTLNRTVAIKVLAPALASSATARLRFAREARAAAAVAHEHIVAIHAVDSVRGLPYIVMQYVPGRSLQGRIDETGPLGLKEILRIGAQTAAGLAAAHAQGLIHRDIKPANILLENCVERVKITDFGLARAVDDASVTQNGVVAGTPQYMAPEQARGKALDGRTDLFSLGSVLYAMSTGHPPFRAETSMAVLHCVCEDTPRSVRALNPEIPDWLEAIIERLHAKDPADRFDTATEVATVLSDCLAHVHDPTRFALPRIPLRNQPRAPSLELFPAGKKDARWSRRWAIAAAALVIVIAGLGAAEATGSKVSELVATILRIPIRDGTLVVEVEDPDVTVTVDNQKDEITITGAGVHEVRLRPGEHQLKAVKGNKSVMSELVSIERGGKQVVRVQLEPKGTAPTGHTDTPDDAAKPAPSVAFGNAPVSLVADDRETWFTVFSPDGKTLATGGRSGVLNLWDVATHEARVTSPPSNEGFRSAAFSPDGRTLATGRTTGTLTLWDTVSGKAFKTRREHSDAIRSVNFEPYGTFLMTTGQDRRINIWDTRTWRVVGTIADVPQPILCSRISPDGTQLAVAFGDPTPSGRAGGVRLYSSRLARQGDLPTLAHRIWAVAFSPDGKTLATGGSEGSNTVRLWDPDTRRERSVLNAPQFVRSLEFSPDGKMLLTAGTGRSAEMGSGGGSALLWDLATLQPKAIVRSHGSLILTATFSPDSQLVATGGLAAQDVRVWKIAKLPPASGAVLQAVAIAPGSNKFAEVSPGNSVESAASPPLRCRSVIEGQKGDVWFAVFAPDGRTLATGGDGQIVRLCDTSTGRERTALNALAKIHAAAYSPDGNRLAVGLLKGTVQVWDLPQGKLIAILEKQLDSTRALAFAPDGKTLAVASNDKTLVLYDATTWHEIRSLPPQEEPILSLAYAPDGATLAIAAGHPSRGGAGWVKLLDATSLEEQKRLPIEHDVWSVAFAPGGKVLATASQTAPESLQLWDLSTGLAVRALTSRPFSRAIAFSPDGAILAVGHYDGTISLWDPATGRLRTTIQAHDGMIFGLAFSPDGTLLATASRDGTAKLWDVPATNVAQGPKEN